MGRGAVGHGVRWWLLCAVALGVVAMHHLGSPGHADAGCAHPPSHTMSAAAASRAMSGMDGHLPGAGAAGSGGVSLAAALHPADCGTAHGMFHLCLAIVGALLLVVLAGTALRHAGEFLRWRGCAAADVGAAARAPPGISGCGILSSTCVLRI